MNTFVATTITSTIRFPQLTRAGNPRYRVVCVDGVFETAPDASVNYEIDNSDLRDVVVELVLNDKRQVIRATRRFAVDRTSGLHLLSSPDTTVCGQSLDGEIRGVASSWAHDWLATHEWKLCPDCKKG